VAAGTNPACVTALRVAAEQHALNDVSDVSLLIEGDFVGQAEVAVALPVVEKYHAKAIMTGWMAERVLGGEVSILKGRWVFGGEVLGCCATGIDARKWSG
jgi:hypothetical protein